MVFFFALQPVCFHAYAAMSIRVVIIEDETMVADMLKAWLGRRSGLQVVGCALDGIDALAVCRRHKPDVVTVDIRLPGADGLAVTEQLLREFPGLKVIILSGRQNPYLLVRAKELGVHGYVDKMSPLTVLEKAIRAVAAGGEYFSESVQKTMDDQRRQPDAFVKMLTPRERDILGLMAAGLSDQEVSTQLNISPETVGTHRRNASRKLDVRGDRKLMHCALELGLNYVANRLTTGGLPPQEN